MRKKDIKKKFREKTKSELWDRIAFLEDTLVKHSEDMESLQWKIEEYQQKVIATKCAGFDALVKR